VVLHHSCERGNRAPPHGARLARRCPGRESEQTRSSAASERGRQRLTDASLSERSEQRNKEGAEAFFPLRATTTTAADPKRDARAAQEMGCERRKSRTAARSRAGAPLSWTTLFRSVSSDGDGGNPANIAASGASHRQRNARAAQEMGATTLDTHPDKELARRTIL
jgi:hypothetical protein